MDEVIKSPAIVDLLPVGFEYVAGSTRGSWSSSLTSASQKLPEPEVIPNYQGTGQTDDIISSSSASAIYAPPETLVITKSVKGNLDSNRLLPPAKAKGEIGSDTSYIITILNNSPIDVTYLTLLDYLPHVGDTTAGSVIDTGQITRGSEFGVSLSGPVTAPSGYTVYYTADAPSSDSSGFANSASWKTAPGDYAQVKAIKLVLNEVTILKKEESFSLTLPVTLPKDTSLENGAVTVNSIGQSVTSQNVFTESNNATLEIVNYKVTGKVFKDTNTNGVYDDEEGVFANHTVTLVDANGELGWSSYSD